MSRYAGDRLPPFAELLLAASQAVLDEGDGEAEPAWIVEQLRVETPWELDLVNAGEGLEIGSAPPTQIVQTSVMPVWHRLAVTVRLDHGRDRD